MTTPHPVLPSLPVRPEIAAGNGRPVVQRAASWRFTVVAVLVLGVALSLAAPAGAEDEGRALELTFSSPGARSMALAGAFAPMADDATAAFANPAGLVQLVRPEVSLELRMRGELESDNEGQTTLGAVSGVSFFSAVVPVQKWSFALYGHQLANLDFTWSTGDGSGAGRALTGVGERLDGLEVGRLGFSVAYQLRENLSLGAGLSYFKGTLELAPLDAGSTGTREVTSSDWEGNAGILWSPSELVQLGVFYRAGPSLGIDPGAVGLAAGSAATYSTKLDLPDSYGAGAAFTTRNRALTVAFEWDHVGYSSLLPGLQTLAVTSPALEVDDADEAHLGGEYAFLDVNPVLAVRGGVWYEPDHRVCSSTPSSAYQCAGGSASQVHVTAGFGMAFKRFQLDLGFDQTKELLALSISGIYSF